MRRDHRAALDLFERETRIRMRSEPHRKYVLGVVRRFLEAVARRRLRELGRGDVERYLAARVKAGVGASMPAREAQALQVFFAALVRAEVLDAEPTAGLVVKRPGRAAPVLLSEDAVGRLLAAAIERAPRVRRIPHERVRAVALRDRALLELLYAVGLRDAEARAALVLDLDLDDASILVRATKRGRQRRVPLPKRSLRFIEMYLGEARPFLVKRRRRGTGGDPGHLLLSLRGTPLCQPSSYGIVRLAAAKAGVARAHPHAFRRAVATHLIRAQVSVPAVQELLGHRSVATTARYLEADREDLRRTAEMLETAGANGPAAASSGDTNDDTAAEKTTTKRAAKRGRTRPPRVAPTGAEES